MQVKREHLSLAILVLYVVLNVGYSKGWKNLPILDIAILASGFVLRILFGGAVWAFPDHLGFLALLCFR